VQAKLDISLWLGEYQKSSRDRPYMSQLPPGYEPRYDLDVDCPPTALVYKGTG